MAPALLWPVVGSLSAGAGTLALAWTLRHRRGRPGATWLLAILGVQAVLTISYGVGFFLFDPVARWVVEVLFWVSYVWLSSLFVAFGLAYTGRGQIVRSPWFALLFLLSAVLTALVITNPFHNLVWTGFRVAPTGGLAGVAFVRKGGAFLLLVVTSIGASVGTLLLVDTIISYGPLYRREALAVALSPLPPGIGLILWTFGISPVVGINLAPTLFLLHVALDAVAFVGTGIFEFHPATRRVGNRAAIADLGSPVFVVDEQSRVVNVNPAAEDAFGVTTGDVLTRPLADCYEGDAIDPATADQDATIQIGGQSRVFRVVSTGLYDGTDTHLGYTLVFQDITAERQREQRLAVLNRVLRHNLRNDLNVVQLRVEEASTRVGDEDVASLLDAAADKTAGVVALGEKARSFEQAVQAAADVPVVVPEVVEAGVGRAREAYPAATITVSGTDAPVVRTNSALLRLVLLNLLENAVEHAGAEPTVTVDVSADRETVTVTVTDDGPGIPEHELAVVADGDESALEHGSGMGLWLVSWGTTTIGGDIAFETDGAGTTATLTLPVVGDGE